MTIRALQVDPSQEGSIAVVDVDEPVPAPHEVLVAVAHASANYGELRYTQMMPPGMTLGFDAAGTVVRSASDGSGPAAGSRVVAIGQGAWSQLATFASDSVAVVPDTVPLADAAAVPMAGLSALRNLRAMGSVLGQRVLVTGASGGVGRYAIQLARLSGAYVIAVSGTAETSELEALGAAEVRRDVDDLDLPVDAVFETVGGPTLMAAWRQLAPGGRLHSIGWASNEPVTLETNAFFAHGASRSLHSSGDISAPAQDLATLMALLESGDLKAEIGWQGPWTDVSRAAEELFARRVAGKIVLDVDA